MKKQQEKKEYLAIGWPVAPFVLLASIERMRRKRKSLAQSIRKKILRRYKFRCQGCGECDPRKLSIDHITPYSKGGKDTASNLSVLCVQCNSKKGAK